MPDKRRPPAMSRLSQHDVLATSRHETTRLKGNINAMQTAIRLATELADDGNFVDANRVADRLKAERIQQPTMEERLAFKLISREVASFSPPQNESIHKLQRINSRLFPVVVTRTKAGSLSARSFVIPNSKADNIVIAPDGNTLVLASGNQLTIVKDRGKNILNTDGHDDTIRLMAISDDGSIVASYGDDAILRIWDAQIGTPLTTVPLRDVSVPYLSISPNGSIVCLAVGNGPAKYIDLKGEGDAHALRPRGSHATAICPLPDGRAFIVGCQDGTTRIIEMKMGRESAILDGDGSAIIHVSVSPDGRRLLAQSRAGRISIFETGNAERTHIWQLNNTNNIQAVFTTNDSIAVAVTRNSIQTLALNAIDMWKSISLPKVEITDALLSEAPRLLICGDTSGRLTKISTATGVSFGTVQCHRRRIQNIRIHPTNKRWITMASWDATASIVDVATLESIRMFTGHADRVRDAMISPDGVTMVTISDDRTCRFWNAQSGRVVGVTTLPNRPLAIESCSNDKAVIIDILATRLTIHVGKTKPIKEEPKRFGTSVTTVRTDRNHVTYLAGSLVAVTTRADSRSMTFTSSNRITASFIHPESNIMLVGTNHGNIQLWNTSTMTELLDVKCMRCEIASVGYSLSGDYIFAIGVDGIARYINLGRTTG